MSFVVNKDQANIKAITLVRMRPRKRLRTWISDIAEPDIYRASSPDSVVGLLINSDSEYVDSVASEAECLAQPNSYFFDEENSSIVLHSPDADPNEDFVVVEWDVRIASRDLNWFKDPRDSSSGDARWEGGLIQAPAPTQGNLDLIFGYSPVQVTSIRTQVADGSLLEHLHDWTLFGSPIKVWVCLGDLETENISELFVGVGGNISMVNGYLDIQVQDPLRLLDGQWQADTFNTDDFPDLDPAADGYPIREVFGYLPTFVPVNIDYPADGVATVTTNRNWVVQKGELVNSAALQTLIDWSGLGNDTTHTKVADARYISPGDNILITENGVKKSATVISVDLTTNIIEHSFIGARASGIVDTVRRGFISRVLIRATPEDFKPEIFYEPRYDIDYTEEEFANGTIGITFIDDFEANGSFPFPDTGGVFDPQQNLIYMAVYGNKALPKKLNGVDDFGQLSAQGGTAGHPVVILWEILRNRIQSFKDLVPMDEAAWQALAVAFDRTIGIAIPDVNGGELPTWKEVAQRLFQTELLRMHFKIEDGETLLTITQTGPAADGGRDATENEVSDTSFAWDFQDIYSRLEMLLNLGELREGVWAIDKDSTYIYPDATEEKSPLRAAAYLHRSEKTFPFRTLFSRSVSEDVGLVAFRVAKLIGERRGTMRAFLPQSHLEETIDGNSSVQLRRLPGFALSEDANTRNYKIQQHSKSANGVSLILDDQKGIADSEEW